MTRVSTANDEAIEAWNGPLFDRFVQFREVLTTGLGAHGTQALALYPPQPGERVLDVGCGFGDATQQIAALVGPDGEVFGIDAAERFVELASSEAEQAGVANARFAVADAEAGFDGSGYDLAFSRFGTMFFANPVAALRNVRSALKPGGRLCMVVWRRKLDNDWMYSAEQVVKGFVERPDDSDEPTCGPGPFSMADADVVSDQVRAAGFADVVLHRCDMEITTGRDLDEAVEIAMALGPGGEVLRLLGERADAYRPQIKAALEAELGRFNGPDGVCAPASTWIVAAVNPG
ncbi:MAG TPA: class I SAM-dependent methyltransferase [Solirubrobacteraceae bacterium]|jgi:ubiquinone/menaquinone biosynthesis C-methylase UbiE|nr:class I SAM-dependent methyltransferase [Solirubrobacteraceae bacterium]